MLKKIIKGHLIIIFIIAVFLQASAVSQQKDKIAQMEAKAKKYFNRHLYHLALPLYQELDSIRPDQTAYEFALGVCYLNTSYQEEKALEYFEKCLSKPDNDPSLYYYLGKCYHLSHKLDKAIYYLDSYIDHLKTNEKRNHSKIEELQRDIQMCQNGKELMADPLDLEIINLGPRVNSIYPEYAAVLSADEHELIFTSCRPGTTGDLKDPVDGRYYEDLYITYHLDSGWTAPVNMGDSVNTSGHDASMALSADGQTLFLYRYDPNSSMYGSGDIYMSELKGEAWSKAKRLGYNINSNIYHEPGASLSPDGKTLFFSSDRPGGYGGMDLYMVKKLPTGEWAIPMNLGSKINTAYDEDFPFIHSDGQTLYFSSNGHKTMGGFDVFVSSFDPEILEWTEPKNVGYPISTAHNDIHFSWSPDGRKIYFSSIREDSYGDQDIYYAVVHEEEPTEVLVLKGFILDSLNADPLHGKITITNTQTNELTGIFNSNSKSGKFLVILPKGHYVMLIEAENHSACEQSLDIINLEGFEIREKNIVLCPSENSVR